MFLFNIKYGQIFETVNDNLRQPNDPLYWQTVKTYKKVSKGYKGILCKVIECKCNNPKFEHLFNIEIGSIIKLPLDTIIQLPELNLKTIY